MTETTIDSFRFGLPTADLDAVADMLRARYPDVDVGDLCSVVCATYRRLLGNARLFAHLIPLTTNRTRSELELQRRPAAGATR